MTLFFDQFGQTIYQNMRKNFKFLKKNGGGGGYIKFIILFLNFPTEFTICGKMPPNKGKFIKIIVTLVYGQFGQTLYQNMPKYFKFLRRKKNNKNNLFRHFSLRGGFYSEDPHELLLVSFFFQY